jgi:hypothetical protein
MYVFAVSQVLHSIDWRIFDQKIDTFINCFALFEYTINLLLLQDISLISTDPVEQYCSASSVLIQPISADRLDQY